MAIVLECLRATGPGKAPAEVRFQVPRTLVTGASETGKSHIFDCLWYLLGGDTPPGRFTENGGYDSVTLELSHEGQLFEVRRALAGGLHEIHALKRTEAGGVERELQDIDIGLFLVQLSGASGRTIYRKRGEKGPITGGDLRHWALLSQTEIINKRPRAADGFEVTQRISSFHLFLTGSDDAAVVEGKTSAEKERLKGELAAAENNLSRTKSGLPPDAKREEVADSLERVDETLSAMAAQYEGRASQLKEVRAAIAEVSSQLAEATSRRNSSAFMLERFQLLDKKYESDLERLGAIVEGASVFGVLKTVDCPLCGTPAAQQIDPAHLQAKAPQKYVKAVAAEASKIALLRQGLLVAVAHEQGRHAAALVDARTLGQRLTELEGYERDRLRQTKVEFAADPKTLALRRSELSAQLAIFDELEYLEREIARLKKAKVNKRVQVNREGGAHAIEAARLAKEYLNAWGFDKVDTVRLDPEACDLVINERPRISFGAGTRAVYLASHIIALMAHALGNGHPHLGVVVIDSPLKNYADAKNKEGRELEPSLVADKFYAWLAQWKGPGQIVVLDNVEVKSADTARLLKPVEFTGLPGVGRQGFYPERDGNEPPPPPPPVQGSLLPED